MTYERALMILGGIIALSPFVGLPYSWLMVLIPVLGLSIISIGFVLRSHRAKAAPSLPQVPHEEIPRSF